MEANLYIDVSLLAIALSMHITKRDRRIVLFVLVALFIHILLTSDGSPFNILDQEDEQEALGAPEDEGLENLPTLDEIIDHIEPVVVEEEKGFTHEDFVKSTVSSGVFGRQISTPQNMLTSTIFPQNSKDANGKLADARGSFFNSLVS